MPLVQINLAGGHLAQPDSAAAHLRAALADLPAPAPAILLIHGYKFSPFIAARNPHTHILSLDPRPCWKAVSWPRRLGLGAGDGHEPLCIGVGWEARGSLWQAYGRAAEAGRGLARLIALLRRLRPDIRLNVLAHSLGGRVALSALPYLPAGAVERAVLLAAAEMQSRAAQYLDTPAGRSVEVLNIVSRQNRLFDHGLEWLVAPHRRGDRAVGRGMKRGRPHWLDLRIDAPEVRQHLAALGVTVSEPTRRICHWSVYLCPALFDVYRAVLSRELPFAELAPRSAACPPVALPRCKLWHTLPLPFPRHEAS